MKRIGRFISMILTALVLSVVPVCSGGAVNPVSSGIALAILLKPDLPAGFRKQYLWIPAVSVPHGISLPSRRHDSYPAAWSGSMHSHPVGH